jgi:hypothetical protein
VPEEYTNAISAVCQNLCYLAGKQRERDSENFSIDFVELGRLPSSLRDRGFTLDTWLCACGIVQLHNMAWLANYSSSGSRALLRVPQIHTCTRLNNESNERLTILFLVNLPKPVPILARLLVGYSVAWYLYFEAHSVSSFEYFTFHFEGFSWTPVGWKRKRNSCSWSLTTLITNPAH